MQVSYPDTSVIRAIYGESVVSDMTQMKNVIKSIDADGDQRSES